MNMGIFLFRAFPIFFNQYFIVLNGKVFHFRKYISNYFVLFYATVNQIISPFNPSVLYLESIHRNCTWE